MKTETSKVSIAALVTAALCSHLDVLAESAVPAEAPPLIKRGGANTTDIQQDVAASQQRRARTIALAAKKESQQGEIDQSLVSSAVKQEAVNQQRMNQQSLTATTPGVIARLSETLPKLTQIGGQLRYGEHIVVSKEGPEIIAKIRALLSSSRNEQRFILEKIQTFAQEQKPEAIHFLGFSSEFGLYGLPKNLNQAAAFYQQAAAQNYQPAIYNLALMSAYGRAAPVDIDRSLARLIKALTVANDTSGRVCGLASFLAYRTHRDKDALTYAKGCNSALANLPKGIYNESEPLSTRVEWLRDSIATGVDDGYALIVKISREQFKTDNNFTFCKYLLVNKYRSRPITITIKEEATRCVDQAIGNKKNLLGQREQIISGVTSFVPTEIEVLARMRKSNKFHYSLAVPYLPFTQAETDLFEPLLIKGDKK
jgi:hypothetical protein